MVINLFSCELIMVSVSNIN